MFGEVSGRCGGVGGGGDGREGGGFMGVFVKKEVMLVKEL